MPTLQELIGFSHCAVGNIAAATSDMQAAVRENFEDEKDGGSRCKLCGDVVAHPRAAAAHLAVHHRKALESKSVEAREFSDKQRQRLSKTGAAMPGGGYPISNIQDLKNAIQAIGRAKDRTATIAHIKSRAKALGATNLIPEEW